MAAFCIVSLTRDHIVFLEPVNSMALAALVVLVVLVLANANLYTGRSRDIRTV